jgi:hypothetical protein
MEYVEFTDPIDIHDSLNPDIWDGDNLRTDVRVALLKIAKEYYKFLDINVPVMDVIITGSQANYNYTKYSDLDLHLIVPYDKVRCDMAIDELFRTKRDLWRATREISIRGVDVELYAEDVDEPVTGSTYSVVRGEWLRKPVPIKANYNKNEVKRLVSIWENIIDKAIATDDLGTCESVKSLLKTFRQAGLDKSGEMNPANLTFKSLRNDGYVGKLIDAIRRLKDEQLSI